jgi:hypothetical protein
MKKRVSINIFLFSSLVILILVLIRIGAAEKILNIVTERINSDENISEDYPEYIYETFVDGNGDEVSVKMEKKTGTLDGEEVVFYEDTIGSEVIFYHFYKGFIEDVDSKKIVFVVKEECLNADPEASFYEYRKVEEYKLVFYLDDYPYKDNILETENRISVNTELIKSLEDIKRIKNKILRICFSKYKDPISGNFHKQLDFYY